MKSFIEFIQETYLSSAELNKVKKSVKKYIIGRVEKARGAHTLTFLEKHFKNILIALEKDFGKPSEDKEHFYFHSNGIKIHVEKPDPMFLDGYMFITVYRG